MVIICIFRGFWNLKSQISFLIFNARPKSFCLKAAKKELYTKSKVPRSNLTQADSLCQRSRREFL